VLNLIENPKRVLDEILALGEELGRADSRKWSKQKEPSSPSVVGPTIAPVEVPLMSKPTAQQIRNAVSKIGPLLQDLAEHPFQRNGRPVLAGAPIFGEHLPWDQRVLKTMDEIAFALERVGLAELAKRAAEKRNVFATEIDETKPMTVEIRLKDNDEPVKAAREARHAEIEKALNDAKNVFRVLEQEAIKRARDLEDQEAEVRRRDQAAAAEAARRAERERQRALERIALFEDRAASNLDRGSSALVSGVLYRAPDSGATPATNLGMTVVLIPRGYEPEGPLGPEIIDFNGLSAFRGVVASDRVRELLAAIREGVVPLHCLPAGVEGSIQVAGGNDVEWSTHDYKAGDRAPQRYREFAGHSLEIVCNPLCRVPEDTWTEMIARLPASSPSFADLDHFAESLDLDDGFAPLRKASFCKVYAPSWLKLRAAEFDVTAGGVTIEVESFWSDLEKDVSVSVIPLSLSSKGENPLSFDVGSWQVTPPPRPGARWLYRKTATVGGPPGPVVVSLNHKMLSVSRATTGRPAARLVAHHAFDPNLRALKARLASSQPGQFEEGMSVLLHLCGFSVANIGWKDLDRAPDFLAFRAEDAVVVGEVTIEPPDGKKVKNLSSRAQAIRSLLNKDGRGVAVVPVMFVRRPRGAMPAQGVEGVVGEFVSLAFEEDIAELVTLASRGESVSTILRFVGSLGAAGPGGTMIF
jgi:hypothetical protein